MEKYIQMAEELKMVNVELITPSQLFFDSRTTLKCRWGCEDFINEDNIRCHDRGTSYDERVEMIKQYENILLLHSHDARQLSIAVLAIERAAFLDGYYFAFAIRSCSLCKSCKALKGEPCPTPEKIRPCDQMFGIDVYKTAKKLNLPIKVLQDKDEIQNRYGFVLIN